VGALFFTQTGKVQHHMHWLLKHSHTVVHNTHVEASTHVMPHEGRAAAASMYGGVTVVQLAFNCVRTAAARDRPP
jgi:hypothetical protein